MVVCASLGTTLTANRQAAARLEGEAVIGQ
jgi:hypothetical protein